MKHWKRLLCAMLAFTLLVALAPVTAYAETDDTVNDSETEASETLIAGDPGEDSSLPQNSPADDLVPDQVPGVNTHRIPFHANPLYPGLVPETDLTPAAEAETGKQADSETEFLSESAAAAFLRSQMRQRSGIISVNVQSATTDINLLMESIFSNALIHTGVPTEGDYLRWHYAGWGAEAYYYISDNTLYATITYDVSYNTSAAQEAEVDAAVSRLIDQLGLRYVSDYDKVAGIYDYICDNVTYDYDRLYDNSYRLKYTAYDALINGTAVCQGYALLLYRLALELGVDARIIAGTSSGESHGWNIVRLNGKYYNLDSTWDAGHSQYTYFLKCNANFPDHARFDEYDSASFNSAYPMSATDYSGSQSGGNTPNPAEKPFKIVNVVSGVHVYWNAVDGVSKYGLWRSETGRDGTYKWLCNPTTVHYTDTNVASGITYYYKVTTMDSAGNHSEKSDAIGITYVATPDITQRENTNLGISLKWNKITGAAGYAVYRKSYSGSDAWSRVATINDPGVLAWNDASVKDANGSAYRYTVRALAGSDLKTLSGCRNTGRAIVRLTARTLSSAVQASTTSVKCTWTTTSQASGYEIRFTADGKTVKTFTVGDYKTGSKTFTGLQTDTSYSVAVRSYKKLDGVGTFYAPWSDEKAVYLSDDSSLVDFQFEISNNQAKLVAYTGSSAVVTIPSSVNGVPVTTIGSLAFHRNQTLQKVTIPASVTKIEDGWCESPPPRSYGAFAECPNLTTVIFAPDSQLTATGEFVFAGSEKLSSVTLPASIRTLSLSCFEECTALTEITLPEGLETIGQNAFTRTGIKNLHIPASCTTVHWANTWTNLEAFTVAEGNPRYRTHEGVLYGLVSSGWSLIGYPVCKPGSTYRVPDYCTEVLGENLGQEDSPKYLKTLYIGNADGAAGMFGGNSLCRLECDVIPDATNPYVMRYNNMLFSKDGKQLIQVPRFMSGTLTVPYGVEYINDYLLWCRQDLTEVILPSSVTAIGGGAFGFCDNLRKVVFSGDAPDIPDGAFWFVTFTANYPAGNSTWTADKFQSYDGGYGNSDVTWSAVKMNPAKPTPNKIVNVVGGVHVYWNAAQGAEKYGLWRSENGKDGTYKWIANPTTAHFTDTTVESGKTYYYKVSVHKPVTNTHSQLSEAIGITYVSTPDITLRVNRSSGIGLGWDKVTGATGYAVYRKSYSGTDPWVRVGTVSGNSTFTWTDTSVKNNNGVSYRYTVRALAGSNMKTLSGCRNTGRSIVRLTGSSLTGVVKSGSGSVTCSWTANQQAAGYEVRFLIDGVVQKSFVVDGNVTTRAFSELESGKTYSVQVRNFKTLSGTGTFYSAWSAAEQIAL